MIFGQKQNFYSLAHPKKVARFPRFREIHSLVLTQSGTFSEMSMKVHSFSNFVKAPDYDKETKLKQHLLHSADERWL